MESQRFVFFGGEPLAVPVLTALCAAGMRPGLVVTAPDVPRGRKYLLTPPPVKVLAEQEGIPVLQPSSLRDAACSTALRELDCTLGVVAAYGKIIPESVFSLPTHGMLVLHPSLLPLLRGPSPIRSAILQDMRTTGVTIMLMDAEVDHGPIVAKRSVIVPEETWPLAGSALDTLLAREGAELLIETIPRWVSGDIQPETQDHAAATYTKKIVKEDGELVLDPCQLPKGETAYQILLKIRAYEGWPGTFFFYGADGARRRIKIVDAALDTQGSLVIQRVIPEGKKEMDFMVWLRSVAACT